MDNDPGRGSRSNEPPKLATVRRLHLDDGEGSSATATEDWYETERLTGHITGRARSTSTIDRAAPSQNEAPAVLDWRHAEATPPPTALERLRRSLERRRRPQLAFRAPRFDSWGRRGGQAASTTTSESAARAATPPPDRAGLREPSGRTTMPTASRAATRSRATRATNGPGTACEAPRAHPRVQMGERREHRNGRAGRGCDGDHRNRLRDKRRPGNTAQGVRGCHDISTGSELRYSGQVAHRRFGSR